MLLEPALTARLTASPSIVAATAGRIVWGRQLQALPAITLQPVADSRPQHFKGFQRVRPTTVQVDVWASTQGAAVELRERVIACLVPADRSTGVNFQRAMIEGVRSGAEQPAPAPGQRIAGQVFRESIDFTFHHNASQGE